MEGSLLNIHKYIIAVDVEGVGTYEVEVPTTQGPSAAARRAKLTVAGRYHRQTDFDKITTRVLGKAENAS